MATEPRTDKQVHHVAHDVRTRHGTTRSDTVERYNRRTRWFHAATYVSVLLLLGTGWWLLLGNEGDPSPLSRLLGTPDTVLHTNVGWFFGALVVVGLVIGARAVRTFVVESLRVDKTDRRWLLGWPRAIVTGRFPRHEGHFDPGQRVLNVVLTLGLLVVVVSGLGMAWLSGGPAFAVLVRLHKWSTYLVTPLLIGHIVVAAGLLPGYRGVWRSMHLGGRLPARVARRLWPAWYDRATRADSRD
ncbi:MAG TPA: cytochrome b/b6 domain-containing protein [Actinopolymorphaceae bacterium]|jgi:formate dehydrogenase subunit gamma